MNEKTMVIAWFLVIIILFGIVGAREAHHARKMDAIKGEYEYRLDMIIGDAARMEAEIEAHKFHRSRPYQDDMNSEEFLEVMANYLARDGRCEVVINKIDWSTWAEAY